jgi:hypothetical protein
MGCHWAPYIGPGQLEEGRGGDKVVAGGGSIKTLVWRLLGGWVQCQKKNEGGMGDEPGGRRRTVDLDRWRRLGDGRKGTTAREVGQYRAKNPSGLGSFDMPENKREKETGIGLARDSRVDLAWAAKKAFCNFYSADLNLKPMFEFQSKIFSNLKHV